MHNAFTNTAAKMLSWHRHRHIKDICHTVWQLWHDSIISDARYSSRLLFVHVQMPVVLSNTLKNNVKSLLSSVFNIVGKIMRYDRYRRHNRCQRPWALSTTVWPSACFEHTTIYLCSVQLEHCMIRFPFYSREAKTHYWWTQLSICRTLLLLRHRLSAE